ncbi:uncharacterized protein LOC121727334 [Aricia agestis]|uniref:uncharacterized protein LOC121727334 n=1 Tax=Aricia agestis TaxID=91739 RepID=UPI001C208791|nr:uncharacterized protein LOC121727334 [Aricia agestis]
MTALLRALLLLTTAVYSSHGACTFPAEWTGNWFQSGVPNAIGINSTHIHNKGECAETEAFDKFLLYDRNYDCYKCMVIHEKHRYVLQYKETFCSQKDSLSSICEEISGDAPLYSMFRKDPPPTPSPCPFHPAPFTFTYNRGSGDCSSPPSRAESCTDDSRLVLRYMACPDVPGTESNVEELQCLATWKEGSTRYLVGKISQANRRNTISTDEDSYRCFIYKGQRDRNMTYVIAQSGDATCNGLSSPTDGSRTMKLTTSDDEHNRCHFPSWIVEHHKWYSLDHSHQYHFTTKNATLKIMTEDGKLEEKRLVCHSILEQKDKNTIKLVAHVTKGCESGHVCLQFVWRERGVLQLSAGGGLFEAPEDACADHHDPNYITLITTALTPTRCPLIGRYTVLSSLADTRRRRQQIHIGDPETGELPPPECVAGVYDGADIGCSGAQDTIEFKSPCTSTAYTCYGSWTEGGRGYLIAAPATAAPARAPAKPKTFCFVFNTAPANETMSISAAASCSRDVVPGRDGDRAYNLTHNGTCEQSSKYNSEGVRAGPALLVLAAALAFAATR